jgi:hypothetical protein
MFILSGNKDKCELLKGVALQEQFITERYAKNFDYGVLQRYAIFDNGAVIRTLYTKTGTKSIIYYPEVVVEEPKEIKVINELSLTIYEIDLVSTGQSYNSFYSVYPTSITRATGLKLKENKYTVFNNYFSLDQTNYDRYEESCVSIINGISNVANDNIFVVAADHRDDWHYKKFMWVDFPYWWASGGAYAVSDYANTWAHPGLQSRSSGKYFHWSHSYYTFGGTSRSHIVRSIDQEKRIYRPGKVDLTYDNDPKQYHMVETLHKAYGKTPWTRDVNGFITRYNERVETTGTGSWSENQPGDNWIMYLWPFVPYLWEIPYFFIYSWSGNDSFYGQCYIPENGLGSRQWSYKYTSIDGVEHTEVKSTDAATFTGNPVVSSSTTAPRPHYRNPGGGDWTLDDGPLSSTWVDTNTSSCNWNCSVEKNVLIGTICDGDVIEVSNKVVLSSSYSYDKTFTHTKDTTFGDGVYLWYPSYTEMWGEGEWVDKSTSISTENTSYSVSGSIASSLKAGSYTVDSGTGTLTYSASRVTTFDYNGEYTWINDTYDYRGWSGYAISTGTRVDNSATTVNCNRIMICFEVLDYDSESNFYYDNNYVKAFSIVYKKITVSSSLPRSIGSSSSINCGSAQAGIISNGGGFNYPPPRDPSESEITSHDTSTCTGTRKVEYILYANIGGRVYSKVLATFNGGLGTGSGQRCYGVVVKMVQKNVLVTYDLDSFVTTANAQGAGSYYDSPLNFEDWNTNLGTKLWETSKRVVGIVSLSDPDNWATELFDEQDPLPDEIYGINMTELKTVIEI